MEEGRRLRQTSTSITLLIFDGLHMMSGSHLKEGHATPITAVNIVIEEADRWRSGIITCAAPSHVSFMGRG